MSTSKKREAQSPLLGEDDDLKRRNIEGEIPVLISLDEISENEDHSDSGSELTVLRKLEGEKKDAPDITPNDTVDSLIGRMDRFMDWCCLGSKPPRCQ